MNENLQYFVGKVCTILTKPTHITLTPEQTLTYFTGTVDAMDDLGITITQIAATKPLKAYYFFNSIVGIAEERSLDPGNPEDAQEINALKQQSVVATKKSEDIQKKIPPLDQKYVDPDALAQVAKTIKDAYNK